MPTKITHKAAITQGLKEALESVISLFPLIARPNHAGILAVKYNCFYQQSFGIY